MTGLSAVLQAAAQKATREHCRIAERSPGRPQLACMRVHAPLTRARLWPTGRLSQPRRPPLAVTLPQPIPLSATRATPLTLF